MAEGHTNQHQGKRNEEHGGKNIEQVRTELLILESGLEIARSHQPHQGKVDPRQEHEHDDDDLYHSRIVVGDAGIPC